VQAPKKQMREPQQSASPTQLAPALSWQQRSLRQIDAAPQQSPLRLHRCCSGWQQVGWLPPWQTPAPQQSSLRSHRKPLPRQQATLEPLKAHRVGVPWQQSSALVQAACGGQQPQSTRWPQLFVTGPHLPRHVVLVGSGAQQTSLWQMSSPQQEASLLHRLPGRRQQEPARQAGISVSSPQQSEVSWQAPLVPRQQRLSPSGDERQMARRERPSPWQQSLSSPSPRQRSLSRAQRQTPSWQLWDCPQGVPSRRWERWQALLSRSQVLRVQGLSSAQSALSRQQPGIGS
jgi:hypothetical protein